MSYTNHTTNLELPQYVGTDKPTYLGDFNTAMSIIDNGYAANKALAEGAVTTATAASNTATQAASDASSAASTANAAATAAAQADTKADTALNSAASANTKADTAISNAAANALKIGDLSTLNTTDKTDVVGAINSTLPTVLYNNVNGSKGNISLSETSANFAYIDIFYGRKGSSGNPVMSYKRVYNPNGQDVALDIVRTSSSTNFQITSKTGTISGTTITMGEQKAVIINVNNAVVFEAEDNIYVYRVEGYK